MKYFKEFLDSIDDIDKRKFVESILNHLKEKFPQLKEEIKWKQPMFTDHGTFIIGFSISKGHMAVAPEAVVISRFEEEIQRAGYSYTKELFRIKWSDKIDFELLEKIVSYNIAEKKDTDKFWR